MRFHLFFLILILLKLVSSFNFRLYNSKQTGDGLFIGPSDLLDSRDLDFDIEKAIQSRVIILVHGFTDSGEASWITRMKDTMLNNFPPGSVDVIIVNWQHEAAFTSKGLYAKAASNTKGIGGAISRLIRPSAIPPSRVYCVGHSLGSHVCGFFGKAIKVVGPLGRISALDPAGPKFNGANSSQRLDKSDALYVDAIHTNYGTATGSIPYAGYYGYKYPIGHADYYPNGGTNQPGCNFLDVACSHSRAHQYFTESLAPYQPNNNKFQSRKCEDFTSLGPSCNGNCGTYNCNMGYWSYMHRNSGIFYLTTNDRSPFSQSN